MNKFIEVANKALAISPVIEGRNKILTDEVIDQFPEGVTITSLDLIRNPEGDVYPVFAIKEDKTLYFNGGALALKVALAWVEMNCGDIEETNKALADVGGVKVKLGKKRTKKGQNLTTFTVIE